MEKEDILKLRPVFRIGNDGMSMVDWFEISEGDTFYSIRSGLNHADGETKSPYHFNYLVVGKGAEKECIKEFNDWWDSLDII